MWLPMDCRPEDRKDYDAEFRASGLGPMQVVVMDVPAGHGAPDPGPDF